MKQLKNTNTLSCFTARNVFVTALSLHTYICDVWKLRFCSDTILCHGIKPLDPQNIIQTFIAGKGDAMQK